MTGAGPLRPRTFVVSGAAVLVLAAGSTVAIAAAAGALDPSTHHGATSAASTCRVPALRGSTVDVRLVDMGSMAGRSMMGGATDWRLFHAGMMRVRLSATSVAAGTVSLRVGNVGTRTHELVVLPLPTGQPAGARTVGSDGTVDETGSLGEASASCAAAEGDGIAAGSVGWVTLRLPAGRYELVCNLPGHYQAGMYAELDVG